MATTRRRLALTLPLMVASLALAAPAGAQFAHGPAFNQVRAVERVQFRDFWDDRGWSNRNNSPGSFWGDRRPSYPNRSYDPYTPYRRQQVYESIKPPAPRQDGDAAGRDRCGDRRFVRRVAGVWARTGVRGNAANWHRAQDQDGFRSGSRRCAPGRTRMDASHQRPAAGDRKTQRHRCDARGE